MLYATLGLILVLCGFISWKLLQPQTQDKSLREDIERLHKELQESRLQDREYLTKTMQGQFRQSTAIIKEVTEKLTKIDETNKQVMNFSEQLQDLQIILKNPKGRGVLSEYWLETLLTHVLQPEQYKMQYTFPDGEIVDAVVFFREQMIPIDAKFSADRFNDIATERNEKHREELEKEFKRDLKLRIDETAKYIRPEAGTTEFAFMFIPADGIYYDLLINKVGTVDVNKTTLIEYAFGKRVVIVSPATFFAYLQTVLQGLKAFKMEESVREVLFKVEKLGRHIAGYESYMQKLGGHLGTTVNTFNIAYKEFQKLDKDIYQLTDKKVGGKVDPSLLERPQETLVSV
ncbi:DNA recombination protein RmuC [Candidatus Peregrinibacteria bacterium]|nr:DNA recombination protein RmuC [Candidatus Peregrinibacteria bacterium]